MWTLNQHKIDEAREEQFNWTVTRRSWACSRDDEYTVDTLEDNSMINEEHTSDNHRHDYDKDMEELDDQVMEELLSGDYK